jgi:aminoglycoside 6'-N-acetyltransferase I
MLSNKFTGHEAYILNRVLMIIRPIEPNDIEKISDLYSLVFSAPPWSEPWNRENAALRLNHIFESKGFVGLLGESEKSIEGMILGNVEPFLNEKTYYLREMCVRLDSQGKGIGEKLLKEMHIELKNINVSGVYLTTKNGIKASKFYHCCPVNFHNNENWFGL